MKSISLKDLAEYLDDYLALSEVPDAPGALNGLQVENSGAVGRIAAAVDACQATIDAAVTSGANLLLVHHGLFWGDVQPVTGRQWRRLSKLLAHDLAVYSAHLPLDCHSEVGNNIVLATALGVRQPEAFGEYHGTPVGVMGDVSVSRDSFVELVTSVIGGEPQLIAAGPSEVKRVGVITGAAGSMIGEARAAGVDTFVTGEGGHHTYFDAEEEGINVIYAGHYATEIFGVKALAKHIEERFGIPWQFVDHPTGL